MSTLKNLAIGGAMSTLLGVGTTSLEMTMAKAQSGTPSQAPGPSNPMPRPSNPQPDPANPQPRPNDPGNTTPIPTPPPTPPENQPGNQPGDQPGDVRRAPGDPDGNGSGVVIGDRSNGGTRQARPFALQSADMESRFAESTRRLVVMEERLDKTNADLMKRLGEVRTMSPERQSAATLDLMQQVLLQQKMLHQYLVTARTAWTGEYDMATADMKKGSGERAPIAETPMQTNPQR